MTKMYKNIVTYKTKNTKTPFCREREKPQRVHAPPLPFPLHHLCVAHSELHLGKLSTVLMSWGGGEVFMVSEGDREIGVKSSHSLGEKAVEQSDRASFDTPVPYT